MIVENSDRHVRPVLYRPVLPRNISVEERLQSGVSRKPLSIAAPIEGTWNVPSPPMSFAIMLSSLNGCAENRRAPSRPDGHRSQ